ncbi:methanogen output domain 1-containing protein [Methylophaga lonarensis]|uniref:methanogen output domain 1-containing protein n=1 Tax=Methylophaga lonarensis TaxID=999151 RepID=UPI003D27B0F6
MYDTTNVSPENLDLPLERDFFMRCLARHLSGTLENIIGLAEAEGFISVVGQGIGDEINQLYREALNVEKIPRDQLAAVLVDLKQRIQGNFAVEHDEGAEILLTSTSCPFGDKVVGRESLCMMTSNVFGTICAENTHYAKVVLEKTIARGDAGCKVRVFLEDTEASEKQNGIEYFRSIK